MFVAFQNENGIRFTYNPTGSGSGTRDGFESITDTEDHSGVANFEQNCKKAAIIAKNITVGLLSEINFIN